MTGQAVLRAVVLRQGSRTTVESKFHIFVRKERKLRRPNRIVLYYYDMIGLPLDRFCTRSLVIAAIGAATFRTVCTLQPPDDCFGRTCEDAVAVILVRCDDDECVD